MIDLQKRLCHRNLCHVVTKKMKSFCSTKHPTKAQVKKYRNSQKEKQMNGMKMMIKVSTFVKILLTE